MCGDAPAVPGVVPCPCPGRVLGARHCHPPEGSREPGWHCHPPGGFLGARHCHPPRPAPGAPAGAGTAGDDGKLDGKGGHDRDSNAGGLEPLPRARALGQAGLLVPRLGSEHPGWIPGAQAGLTAPRACASILIPRSFRSYFKFSLKPLGEGGTQAVSQRSLAGLGEFQARLAVQWRDPTLSSRAPQHLPWMVSPALQILAPAVMAEQGAGVC